jgi:hypothetical protein
VVRVEQPALEPILQRLEHGLPYTPVASIPTSVTPASASHAASSASPASVARNVRVCWSKRRRPAPGTRTVATTLSRCTSRPAHRSTTTSVSCSLPTTVDMSPGGGPKDESDLRARSGNERSHRSPRHAVARALTHQASPASIRATSSASAYANRRATSSAEYAIQCWRLPLSCDRAAIVAPSSARCCSLTGGYRSKREHLRCWRPVLPEPVAPEIKRNATFLPHDRRDRRSTEGGQRPSPLRRVAGCSGDWAAG